MKQTVKNFFMNVFNWIKSLFAKQTYELTIKHMEKVSVFTIDRVITLNQNTASFRTLDGEKHTLKSADKMSWHLRKVNK